MLVCNRKILSILWRKELSTVQMVWQERNQFFVLFGLMSHRMTIGGPNFKHEPKDKKTPLLTHMNTHKRTRDVENKLSLDMLDCHSVAQTIKM